VVDGLVVATGHHRNGILLTPVTAEAVAAAVTGETVPPEVAPCDPRRFAPAGARS
jgi:glycine oxidase